ncbi:MAG: DMT family transporter [Burkholderiales bacterium]|nr:MAG: DMT family transporter [Betaproteobacteria bacterium]TAG83929.1 MAG: DMT family transporter [Burkholderiales bacterium]
MLPRRELTLFIAVVLLWGVNWPMMKMALAELDFWVFRTWCIVAGILWFLGYHLKTGVSLAIPREHWWRLAVCALCNVAGWNLLSASGLSLLPSGRAGILAYTMPLWVVLLSRFLLNDVLTKSRIAAIAIGMLGIALLLIDEFNALRSAPVGALLMVSSGFVWAFGIILTKGFPRSVPTTSITLWSFIIGGWPILLGAIVSPHNAWLPTSATAWAGLLYNVVIVFGFCWFAWNELVRNLPAQVTGISSLAVPVVGFVSGMLILGERPRAFDYIALLAIVMAVAMVLLPTRKRQ